MKTRAPLPSIEFTHLPSTAFLMATIAGFIDVFGFVNLSKLFTAHITGNIVIAIAELISHSTGVAAKLIALPVFIFITMIVTWTIEHNGQKKSTLVSLLLLEAALLSIFMCGGYYIVPLGAIASWQYISIGMFAVSAMAIHNTLLRTFMVTFPACTAMTSNFCQLIVDIVSYLFGKKLAYPVETLASSISGMRRFGNVLLGFCLGGSLAAIGTITIGFWSVSFSIILLLFMCTRVSKRVVEKS